LAQLKLNYISDITTLQPCTILAAVGDGMAMTTGVIGKFFSALGSRKINVLATAQGCSERNISAVIKQSDATAALQAVHSEFHLSHSILKVAIVCESVGKHSIGLHLLKLLQEQREKFKKSFDIDIQVFCVFTPGAGEGLFRIAPNRHECVNNSITTENFSNRKTKTPDPNFHFTEGESEASLLTQIPSIINDDGCSHSIIFDATASPFVSAHHVDFLKANINVVTANNTALSDDKTNESLVSLCGSEKVGQYMIEVCVGGGLPVIRTLRNLLDTGDKILRVDGIMSTGE